MMRILVISWYYPPSNVMGAVSTHALVSALVKAGHDVQIIAPRHPPLPTGLEPDLLRPHIWETPFLNINAPFERLLGRAHVQEHGYELALSSGVIKEMARAAAQSYKTFTHIPDGQCGWIPFAVREARRLCETWRPDIVVASSPPQSSLLIARRVARRVAVPWIAWLRDPWVTKNPYYPWSGRLRSAVDKRMEQRVLDSAKQIISASPGWVADVKGRFVPPIVGIPTGVPYSAYSTIEPIRSPFLGLRVVHTGMLYHGHRDPTMVFNALRKGNRDARQVRVEFYGRYLAEAGQAARRANAYDYCHIAGQVDHKMAMSLQKGADALLLLMATSPSERHVIPGKFYEYVAAGRPILAVGHGGSAVATIIREHQLGAVATTEKEVSDGLSDIFEGIASGQFTARQHLLDRDDQMAKYVERIMDCT